MESRPLNPKQKLQRFFHTDVDYLIRGGGWTTLGQGTSTALSFATAVAMANLIPKETYGAYKYILSIISLLSIPTLSGMTHAVMQATARNELGVYTAGIKEKLLWGSLGSFASAMISLYYFSQGNTEFGFAFLIASPLIPVVEAYTLWGAFLAGKKLFRESMLTNLFVQLTTTIIMLVVLWVTKSTLLMVCTYLSTYAITRYFVHLHLCKKFPEMNTQGDASEQVRFGRNVSFANIIGTVTAQLDTMLLWQFFGPTALATYAFAQATTTPAKTFMKSLVHIALPKFSEKNIDEIRTTIHKKVLRSYLVFFPITACYILVLPFVYKLFFPEYTETIVYAQTLGLIFLFFPLKLYAMAVISRTDRLPTYWLNIVNPIINAILFVVLIPLFGIWGAVYAILAEYVFSALTTFYFFTRAK